MYDNAKPYESVWNSKQLQKALVKALKFYLQLLFSNCVPSNILSHINTSLLKIFLIHLETPTLLQQHS
jgi:hypothetical protein